MCDLESVRVALRVRPMVPSETARGCQVAVEKIDGADQVLVNNSDAFSFNFVFDYRDTQEQVYNLAVNDMLDKLFSGFNATILAYGQTGSGKTHTMGTAFDGELNEDVGVIPRAMHDIFERVHKLSEEFDFSVKCSFMELYQEQLYDLLSEKSREESTIDMREDRSGIIMVGLTELQVTTAKETTDCLVRGSSGRAVASTAMNQQSSRSHAIFTVTLQATKKDESRAVTTSKFHLVDLAGSERSKKTGATGDRFKEGVKINQGLLALGNVISALGEGKGTGFVRYRDSKLTRLLQDSLGGNSVTLMIACVSPADYNVAETLSTLRYADRARKIKNKPIVNQDPHAAEINRLKGIIQKLRVELLTKGGSMSSSLTTDLESVGPVVAPFMTVSMPAIMPSEEHTRKYNELQEKYRTLLKQWQITMHDLTALELRAHIAETLHDNIKTKSTEMRTFVDELLALLKETSRDEEKLMETAMCISKLVAGLDDELVSTEGELIFQKQQVEISASVHDSEEDPSNVTAELQAIMQERTDYFTNKQMEINTQLRQINRELCLKEQLQHRIAGNFDNYLSLNDNMEEKFKECEKKIKELEEEKADLMDKLKHVKNNTSAKLAEDRRKRLQILEQEINEMKKQNVMQAKLLKIRENETHKIKNLSTEIKKMKEAKVKLVRAMRAEGDTFRQIKKMKEKELLQLRNKDRKMQNEMARKEALHDKQRNVLKLKYEEALAINRRLKDALDRQNAAQKQRQKLQSAKDANAATVKIEQVIVCVERELEVIISLIDAERTLEQLMDDRGIISSRIAVLKKQKPHPETSAALELANLKEEFDMRNSQISELQQKVCANDVSTLIRSLVDNILSVTEAKAVLKHLLESLVEIRRENALAIEELRTQLNAADDRCVEATNTIKELQQEQKEIIAEYEEKISVALTPEQEQRLKQQEEQQNKIESLINELEKVKQMNAELSNGAAATTTKKSKTKSSVKNVANEEMVDEMIDEGDIFVSDDEDDYYTSDIDPEWSKTPLFRRRRAHNLRRTNGLAKSMSQSDISNNMEESQQQISFDSTNSGALGGAAKASDKSKHKRKPKGCKCRGDCGNQRCGCNSLHTKCTIKCNCTDVCKNRDVTPSNNDGGEDLDGEQIKLENDDPKREIESTPPSSPDPDDENNAEKSGNSLNTMNDTFYTTKSTFPNAMSHLTPKMARLSTINFETATSKKKFFND